MMPNTNKEDVLKRIVEQVIEQQHPYIDNYNKILFRKMMAQLFTTLQAELIYRIERKARTPWDHYFDAPGEVQVVNLEDTKAIISSVFGG